MARKGSGKLMQRTTVDLPILKADAMKRAAFKVNEEARLPWSGMFQRFIEAAITHELERTTHESGLPFWPLNKWNMPPQRTNGVPPKSPDVSAGNVLVERKERVLREALPPELRPAPTDGALPDEAHEETVDDGLGIEDLGEVERQVQHGQDII